MEKLNQGQIEVGKKEEKKSFLAPLVEKFFNSKTAKVMAFIAMLNFQDQFNSTLAAEKRPTGKPKSELAASDFNLGSLTKSFDMEVPIKGDKYVLHIAQMHGQLSYEVTEKMFIEAGSSIDQLILVQKDIESLILEITKKYNVRDFYLEGHLTDAENFLDIMASFKKGISEYSNSDVKDGFEMILSVPAMNESYLETFGWSRDSAEAHMLYSVYSLLNVEIARLEGYYRDYKTKKDVPEKFQKFFEQEPDIPRYIQELKGKSNEIRSHKLISGDHIYVWGAAEKLALEGKINIKPSETFAANQAIYEEAQKAVYSPETTPRESWVVERGHNQREDVALNLMIPAMAQGTKFTPIIYGADHNFINNLQTYNGKNNTKIGLITVIPKSIENIKGKKLRN